MSTRMVRCSRYVLAFAVLMAALTLVLAIPGATLAEGPAWSRQVVGVADGDTITVMHDGRGERIRLYGIDTSEKGQGFGQKAKSFTAGLVAGKVVTVVPADVDRYGRTVCWPCVPRT